MTAVGEGLTPSRGGIRTLVTCRYTGGDEPRPYGSVPMASG